MHSLLHAEHSTRTRFVVPVHNSLRMLPVAFVIYLFLIQIVNQQFEIILIRKKKIRANKSP